jgi:hypothetical protein
MVKLNDNDIEIINTFKNKFSKELRPKLGDGDDQIGKFIENQIKKIREIESLIKNINNEFGEENTIAKKYVNFLEYIKALIEAKIQKDRNITNLLKTVFETIGEYIVEIKAKEFTIKETPIIIKELIDIDNVNTSMNVNGLTLSDAERVYVTDGKVKKDNLTGFITEMILDCKKTLEDSISTFRTELDRINQTGGEGEIMEISDDQIENQKITTKTQFDEIKTRYENGLKENIESYKDICNVLTNNDNGLVTTVINSLRTIINKERKINKKFKINLNSIFHEDNPFAENKAAFIALKNKINAAKSELSNNTPRSNNNNPPGNGNGGPPSGLVRTGEENTSAEIAQQVSRLQVPTTQVQRNNIEDNSERRDQVSISVPVLGGKYKMKKSKKTSMKVAKKTSSKEKAKENKNKKIVKSYRKSKSKKQSGGFIRGGVLFPQDFYDTSTVM